MIKEKLGEIYKKYKTIITNTIDGFLEDKGMKLSAALAYNTIFSLGPLFFIIIFIIGNLFSDLAIDGRIYDALKDIMGSQTAEQIQKIVIGLQSTSTNVWARIISIVALVIGATGVFTEIQDSLNFIWGVKVKKKKGVIKLLITRLVSFSMIIGLGFLMVVFLMVNTIVIGVSENFLEILQLNKILPEVISKGMLSLVNNIIIFCVLSLLFTIIFKLLPDVRIKTREVWPGAFLTTVLFMLGKYVIGIYVANNKIATLYGAASSVIVILIWIYFSAIILYIGAEFTRSYIEYKNEKIHPNKYAEYDQKRLLEQYVIRDKSDDGKANYSLLKDVPNQLPQKPTTDESNEDIGKT